MLFYDTIIWLWSDATQMDKCIHLLVYSFLSLENMIIMIMHVTELIVCFEVFKFLLSFLVIRTTWLWIVLRCQINRMGCQINTASTSMPFLIIYFLPLNLWKTIFMYKTSCECSSGLVEPLILHILHQTIVNFLSQVIYHIQFMPKSKYFYCWIPLTVKYFTMCFIQNRIVFCHNNFFLSQLN